MSIFKVRNILWASSELAAGCTVGSPALQSIPAKLRWRRTSPLLACQCWHFNPCKLATDLESSLLVSKHCGRSNLRTIFLMWQARLFIISNFRNMRHTIMILHGHLVTPCRDLTPRPPFSSCGYSEFTRLRSQECEALGMNPRANWFCVSIKADASLHCRGEDIDIPTLTDTREL